MDIPMPLVIFQLKVRMEKKTRRSIPKRMAMEQTMPVAETVTPSPKMMAYRSQGSGSLKVKKIARGGGGGATAAGRKEIIRQMISHIIVVAT